MFRLMTQSQVQILMKTWHDMCKHKNIISQISEELRSKGSIVRTLGLLWDPCLDVIRYAINKDSHSSIGKQPF
jgi:hypothetical protein